MPYRVLWLLREARTLTVLIAVIAVIVAAARVADCLQPGAFPS